jgi:hypothetical protein
MGDELEDGRSVKKDGLNLQVQVLIKAMMESEPCLFNNSAENLFPVKVVGDATT